MHTARKPCPTTRADLRIGVGDGLEAMLDVIAELGHGRDAELPLEV